MQWLSNKFELSRNDGAGNVRPMEGLRGFAVFLVFLVHYATQMSPWVTRNSSMATAALAMHAIGNAGVDLFFVLSGYLIYGSLITKQQDFFPFIRRRIARIYPTFTVVFAIYLLLSVLQPSASKIPSDGITATLYIVKNYLLFPGIFKVDPIITVAWSLSYEMLYYLVMPLLLLFLNMRTKTRAWRSTFFIIAGTAILLACTAFDGPLRLVMFIGGIVLYEAFRAQVKAPRSGFVAVLVIAGLAFQAAHYYGEIAWAMRIVILIFTYFFLCLHCFSQPKSWIGGLFSFTPLRWLGNMSYSYYLLHGLALQVSVRVLLAVIPTVKHEVTFLLGILPIIFVMTLFPSAMLFLLIERPFSLKKQVRLPPTASQLADNAI